MAGKGGDTAKDLGLLALRVGVSGMLIFNYGWPKLVHFADRSTRFSDPLHVGSPVSLALAISAELFCATAVLLGFATRYAVVPLLILFGVIIFVVKGGEAISERELAILYAIPFLAIALLGPGRFSIDGSRGNA